MERAPRLAGNVRRLRDEHPEIAGGAEQTLERLKTPVGADEWPLDQARDDLQRFIGSGRSGIASAAPTSSGRRTTWTSAALE